jgi:phosphopantothenoylcysteine decarboxylase/phosphopantothenate--cysteine ligase
MAERRILLAVTGGIAAYKTPELARTLRRAGFGVRCALTREAARFVSPLVLQTLSGHAVRSELFDPAEEGEIDHVALADWAELVLVAPATAHTLARMAHGLADDLVSTLLLATRAPVLVAPAMNVNMWNHPATRANLATLRERGVRVVGPDTGFLACGWEGEGRMVEPEVLLGAAEAALVAPTLAGTCVLVTAGGTREAIDPVRVLGNRSSGRMGFAVAAEAARRGAEVVLVAAPSALATPWGVRRVDVESALEMRDAVLGALPRADVVVMAAAVADFRPARPLAEKIRKQDLGPTAGLQLELVRNPDILAEVGERKGARIVVGFAAESGDPVAAARGKLERKRCDLVVANDVTREGAGFDVDTNAVVFVWPGGETEELPLLPKREVAAQLLDRVEKLRGSRT